MSSITYFPGPSFDAPAYSKVAQRKALSPQNRRLLAALQSGRTVTRLTSMFDLQIACVTTRVVELRDAGFDVKTRMRQDNNGRRYAEYYLPNAAPPKSLQVLAAE